MMMRIATAFAQQNLFIYISAGNRDRDREGERERERDRERDEEKKNSALLICRHFLCFVISCNRFSVNSFVQCCQYEITYFNIT